MNNLGNFSRANKISGRPDLNGRPPRPKRGALTGLRYSPIQIFHKSNNFLANVNSKASW